MKYAPHDFATAICRVCDGLSEKEQCEVVCTFADMVKTKAGLHVAHEVLEVLPEVMDQESGVVKIEIKAAREMRKEEVESIVRMLGVKGELADVKINVDPRLLGGFIAKTPDKLVDASLLTRVERVRASMAGARES